MAWGPLAWADEPSERWKRRNDLGNRYEGRVEVLVGRTQLDVVSFSGWRESYEPDESVELEVGFFLPVSGEVTIQARELVDQTQYFMEAKPQEWEVDAWNTFGPWATGDVLSREQIAPSNVGIVISASDGASGDRILMPAFVYHSQLPEVVVAYTLRLRPDSDLRQVRYRLLTGDEEAAAGKLVDALEAGKPFPIKLEVVGLPEGRLRLELEGKFKNRPAGPKASFEFHHRLLPGGE